MSQELDHPQELEDLLNECILSNAIVDVLNRHEKSNLMIGPLIHTVEEARHHLCSFCNPLKPDERRCCIDIIQKRDQTRDLFKSINCLYHARQAKDLGDRYEKKYKVVSVDNKVVPPHEKNKTWGKMIQTDPDFKPEQLKDDYKGHPAEKVAPLPQMFFNEETGLFEKKKPDLKLVGGTIYIPTESGFISQTYLGDGFISQKNIPKEEPQEFYGGYSRENILKEESPNDDVSPPRKGPWRSTDDAEPRISSEQDRDL